MTRRPFLALTVFGLAAPVAFLAVGAGPAVASYVVRQVVEPAVSAGAEQPEVFLLAGIAGACLVLAGLLGVGLSRAVDVPAPDPLDDELVRLYEAEATNPRGVHVFMPHPLTGGQE